MPRDERMTAMLDQAAVVLADEGFAVSTRTLAAALGVTQLRLSAQENRAQCPEHVLGVDVLIVPKHHDIQSLGGKLPHLRSEAGGHAADPSVVGAEKP